MKTRSAHWLTATVCLLLVGCGGNDASTSGQQDDATAGQGGAGTGQDDPEPAGELAGAYYVIAAKHSGKVIDIPGWNTASGVGLQQYGRHDGDSQIWQLVDAGGGSYKIVSKHSKKVLAVLGDVSSTNAKIVQSDWIDEDRRKWDVVDLGDGYYRINSVADSNKVVDVDGDLNMDDFAPLALSDWSGSDDQVWSFDKLSEVPAVADPTADQGAPDTRIVLGSYYMITARHSEKALNVSGASVRSGIIVQQWDQADWDNEKFQVADAGGGYYKLVAKHSGKVLEARGEFVRETSEVKSRWLSGSRIIQSYWKDIDSQKWQIAELGSGYYKVSSKLYPDKVVQVSGGNLSMGNGTKLDLGEWADRLDQHWFFKRLPDAADSPDTSKPNVVTPRPSILDIPHSTAEEGIVLKFIHQTRENAIRNGFEDWSFNVDLSKLCGRTTDDENRFVQLVNDERARAGRGPYTMDRNLLILARIKVDDQMQNNQAGHFSDVYGGPGDMAANFSAVGATNIPGIFAEDFSYGNSAEESFTAWMASPAHREPLLGGGNALGFAVEKGPPAAGRSIAIMGNR